MSDGVDHFPKGGRNDDSWVDSLQGPITYQVIVQSVEGVLRLGSVGQTLSEVDDVRILLLIQ